MSDDFNAFPAPHGTAHGDTIEKRAQQATEIYPYFCEDGRTSGYVLRFDERGKKRYTPYFYGTLRGKEGFHTKAPPKPRPLYKGWEAATRSEFPILVVEGEKAADAAQVLLRDYWVVSPMGGVDGALHAKWDIANDRDVIVWPDNDEAGKRLPKIVYKALRNKAKSIRTVDVPNSFPEKWDLADRLPEGIDEQKIRDLVKDALPEVETRTINGVAPMSLFGLLTTQHKEPVWIAEDLLFRGGLTLLSAKPKVGKSALARHIIKCVAREQRVLGKFAARSGPIVSFELDEHPVGVARYYRDISPDIAKGLPIHIFLENPGGDVFETLSTVSQQYDPILIVVDNIVRFAHVEDFNNYSQVSQLMDQFGQAARAFHTAILLIHHDKKKASPDGGNYLGSTGFFGAADIHVCLTKDRERRFIRSEGRFNDIDKTGVRFDPETLDMTLGDDACPQTEREDLRDRIRQTMTPDKWQTKEQIRVTAKVSPNHLNSILKEMVAGGDIEQTGSGVKNDPLRFRIEYPIPYPPQGGIGNAERAEAQDEAH